MARKKNINFEKLLIIFVEGQSEKVFYTELCQYISTIKKSRVKYKIRTLKGVGNFANKPVGILKHKILSQYDKQSVRVFLAYDTDVFDERFSEKPPVNWKDIENKIKNLGVKNIYHLKAKKSIEDWFLIDIEGLCKHLNIRNIPKLKGNGIAKMKKLFKEAGKIYTKGYNTNDFLQNLDYKKIFETLKNDLSSLYNEM